MGEHPHHHGDRLSAALSDPLSGFRDGSNHEVSDAPSSRKQQHEEDGGVDGDEMQPQSHDRASRRQSYPAPPSRKKASRSKSSDDLSDIVSSRNKADGAPRIRSKLKRRSSTGSCAPDTVKKEGNKSTKSGACGETSNTKTKSSKGHRRKPSRSTSTSNNTTPAPPSSSTSKRTSKETRRSKSTDSLTVFDASKNKDDDAGEPDSKQQRSKNSLLDCIPENKLPEQTSSSTKQRKGPRRSKSASASLTIGRITEPKEQNKTTTAADQTTSAPPAGPMMQFIIEVDTPKTHGPILTIVPGMEMIEEQEEQDEQVESENDKNKTYRNKSTKKSSASTRDWSFRSVRTNTLEEQETINPLSPKGAPPVSAAAPSDKALVLTPATLSPTDSLPSPFSEEEDQVNNVLKTEGDSSNFDESLDIRLGESYIVVESSKTNNSNSASSLSSTSRSKQQQQQQKQLRHLQQQSFGSGDSSFTPPFASEDSDAHSTASSSIIQWWAADISGRMLGARTSAAASKTAQTQTNAAPLFNTSQQQQQQKRSSIRQKLQQPQRLGNMISTTTAAQPRGGSEFSVGTISTIGDGDDTIAGSDHLPMSNLDWMDQESSEEDQSTTDSDYSDGDVEDAYVREYVELMQQQRKVVCSKTPQPDNKHGKTGKQKYKDLDNDDLQEFLRAGVDDDDDESLVSEYTMPPGYMVSKTDRVAQMVENMKRQESAHQRLEPTTPVVTRPKKNDPKTPLRLGLKETLDDGITPKITNVTGMPPTRKLMEGFHESFSLNFITDLSLRGGNDSIAGSSLSASTVTSEDFSLQSHRRAALMAMQKGIGGSVGSSLVSSFNHSLTSINEDHELSGEQMELLELGSKVSPRRGKRPKSSKNDADDSPPKLPQRNLSSATLTPKQQTSIPSLIGPNDGADEEKENAEDDVIAYASSSGGSSGDSGSRALKGRTIEMPDVRANYAGTQFLQLDFLSQNAGQVRFADNTMVNVASEQEEERLVNALRRPPKTVTRKGQRRPGSDKANKNSSKGKNEVPDIQSDLTANFLQLDFASMAGQVQYADNTMVNNAVEREEDEMPELDDVQVDDVPKSTRKSRQGRKQQRVSSPPLAPQDGVLGHDPGNKSLTNLFRSSRASSGRNKAPKQEGKRNDPAKSGDANLMDRLWQFGGNSRNLLPPADMENSIHIMDGAESVISQHSY